MLARWKAGALLGDLSMRSDAARVPTARSRWIFWRPALRALRLQCRDYGGDALLLSIPDMRPRDFCALAPLVGKSAW